MTKARLLLLAAVSSVVAACTPSVTTTTSASSATAPVPTSGALSPVGYRPEFGTMWTFDAPPLEYWKRTYGFTPDQAWLDNARLASIRTPNCSASFVSSRGLVLTNHHCVRDCADQVSPKDTNYIETGFVANNITEEKKCPGMRVDQLESIENVTARVNGAVTSPAADVAANQRTAIIGQIQTECAEQTHLTCQVVSLYQGGIYSVYRYRRFDDVRLVFAPEEAAAAFGGDPDNFTYPRFDLDAGIMRVYVDNKPFAAPNYFRFSQSGAKEGEAVFIVGNPGSTGRLLTVAQMEFLRDVGYPAQLGGYARGLDAYHTAARTDPSAERRYQNNVFGLENSRKAVTGYRSGLTDTSYMAAKKSFEREFRARIAADPKMSSQYGGVYDAIASAQQELASFDAQRRYRSYGLANAGGGSRLLNMSGQLVRVAHETALPDSQRLAAYRGNAAASIRSSLLNAAALDTSYEKLAIAAQLKAAKAELAPDDPFLVAALGGRTPDQAAADLVRGTRIGDAAFRKSLIEGGEAAIAASTDPMIVLARKIDVMNREVQLHADRLNAVIAANTEKLGRALFAVYGTSLPPDATFTLRISDGIAAGYPMNGTIAPYKDTFYGLYDRAASFDYKEPFAITKRWMERRDRLDLSTPYNWVSTNDIIGGNSGSPVINRSSEIVGVAFDGNIEGVANRFYVNPKVMRTVNVHSSAILEALRKIYDASWIADELQGK
ncbi:MAG TPA: S46 family peptidase [Gemmatimonadaceae bacterium]|nr:S46 family peptidase [Gemmatimonadaceae bacterium]